MRREDMAPIAYMPIESRIKAIRKQHAELKKTLKKAAVQAFEMGRLLTELQFERDPAIPWKDFFSAHFDFSIRTASNYMRLYELYRDKPKELENQSLSEAYMSAGVKKISSAVGAGKPANPREFASPEEEREYDIEDIFAQPPVSHKKLEQHRIEPMGDHNRLWLITRDGQSMPVAQLYTTEPAGFPKAEKIELLRDVQIALEAFYSHIEEYERRGVTG